MNDLANHPLVAFISERPRRFRDVVVFLRPGDDSSAAETFADNRLARLRRAGLVHSREKWWYAGPDRMAEVPPIVVTVNGRTATLPAWVLDKIEPEPNSGCWLWASSWNGLGYGKVKDGSRHLCAAHRLFYTVYKGDIPDGLSVLHKCDTPPCVNPDHLFLGDQGDNMRDMAAKKRGAGLRNIRGGSALKAALGQGKANGR